MDSLHAQNLALKDIKFRQFTEKDGVSPIMYNAYTDKSGFTWFSSLDLKRFDGHHFKTYFGSEEGHSFGQMIEDKNGGLFLFFIHHGFYKYDKKKDKFLPFQDSIMVGGKKVEIGGSIDVDSKGDIWLGGSHYIARLKNGGNKFEDVTPLLGLPYLDFVSWVDIDENDHLWLSNEQMGMVRINTRTLKVTTGANNNDHEPVFDKCFGNGMIKKDRNNNLWMLIFDLPQIRRELLRYDLKSYKQYKYVFPYKSKVKLEFEGTWVHNFFIDHHGTVWVRPGENVGIARYLPDQDKFEILYTQKHNENGFEGGFFPGAGSPQLVQDNKTDNFWVSSDHVMSFNPYKQNIRRISNESLIQNLFGDQYEQFENLTDAAIRNIIQAKNGKYYVSYNGLGIVRFDADWNNPKHIRFENNTATYQSILFTTDGITIYFNDNDSNIYSFDISSEKVKKIIDGNNNDRFIRSYYVENDTTVWLGHIRTGMSKFNPKTKSLQHFPISFIPKNINTESSIYKIIPQGKHHLWLGTYLKGLQLFDKRTGDVVKQWSHQGTNVSHPKSGYIDILPYGKDTLLLASAYGIIILNTKTMIWDDISTKDGLPDNVIMQILKTKNPDIVVLGSQTKGFQFVNIKTKKITIPSEEQGNEWTDYRNGGMINNKGELILGSGNQGIIIVKPETTVKDNLEVKITELYLNDSIYETDQTIPTKTIRLEMPESKNKIVAKFSIMDVWYCSSTEYSVKLVGSNSDWIQLKSPEISYQALRAGTYELWIKATDSSTGRTTTLHALTLEVLSPWYKTWWFLTLLAGLIGSSVYAFYVFRVRQNQKLTESKVNISKLESENFQKQLVMEQIEKQLNEVKLEVLRAQMNPHFIFNSLNSIENYIIKNDKKAASEYLHIFSKLIRNSLDSSRNEVITLEKELETVSLYVKLEQMRFRNSFDFMVNVSKDLMDLNPLVPPMLIQPFIENAILHGLIPSKNDDLKLILDITKADDKLIYKIIDNGIGRKASKAYKTTTSRKSEGINITTQRLKMNNGSHFEPSDMTILDMEKDGIAAGTTVVLIIRSK